MYPFFHTGTDSISKTNPQSVLGTLWLQQMVWTEVRLPRNEKAHAAKTSRLHRADHPGPTSPPIARCNRTPHISPAQSARDDGGGPAGVPQAGPDKLEPPRDPRNYELRESCCFNSPGWGVVGYVTKANE